MTTDTEERETVEMVNLETMETFSDSNQSDESQRTYEREKWTANKEYILSMVGYCIGFGNLWRFPYVCNRNGGGAFLIPFIIFLILCGFPMFSLESALGQFSGKNSVQMWSFCPVLKGTGVGGIVMSALYTPVYGILLAWPIYYMVKSCSTVLPWTTCGNAWNTPLCLAAAINSPLNISLSGNGSETISVAQLWKNNSLAHSSVEEFWQYNVLSVSSGIEKIGSVQWHIAGCMLAGYLIVLLCLSRGLKLVGKVVYVTVLTPYILLIIIFIRTLILPGALNGVLHYVQPDFSNLLTIQVWLEACVQVFHSLGLSWGIIATSASHNRFHERCIRDSVRVAAISECTSIFAGFVTFAVLGVMAERFGLPVSEVVSSGPGLVFVAYPQALALLPFPQIWSFIFFLMLLTVEMDTQIVSIESVLTVITDRFPRFVLKRRLLILGGLCFLSYVAGIIYCTQCGAYVLQIVDWYLSSLSAFIFCVLHCIGAAWIYGKEVGRLKPSPVLQGIKQMSRDIEMMLGKPLSVFVRVLWAITAPAVLLVAFIITLTRYQPPTYGKYTYPDYAVAIGWIIAALPIIPLPVYAFVAIRKHMTSGSFREGIVLASRPDSNWKPDLVRYRKSHRENLAMMDHSFLRTLKDIIQS